MLYPSCSWQSVMNNAGSWDTTDKALDFQSRSFPIESKVMVNLMCFHFQGGGQSGGMTKSCQFGHWTLTH